MVHKLSRNGGKLVGLSNALNRPKVDDIEDVYAHIFNSIVDQRLPPGTKLNEVSWRRFSMWAGGRSSRSCIAWPTTA